MLQALADRSAPLSAATLHAAVEAELELLQRPRPLSFTHYSSDVNGDHAAQSSPFGTSAFSFSPFNQRSNPALLVQEGGAASSGGVQFHHKTANVHLTFQLSAGSGDAEGDATGEATGEATPGAETIGDE